MNETDPILYTQWQDWRSHYISGGNARETAYQIIRDKIINLEYNPGEPLSDKLLAEQLEMSRTPVHEALIILASSNMVVLKPQIGTFVAPIDLEWVELEQFARFAMEKEIIALACSRLTDELTEMYEQNVALYESYTRNTATAGLQRLLELDNTFHRIAFIAANREPNYFYMMNSMQHMERLRMLSLRSVDQKQNVDDHTQISQAVIQGNVVKAQYWLEQHLLRYKENLKLLRKESPEYFQLG